MDSRIRKKGKDDRDLEGRDFYVPGLLIGPLPNSAYHFHGKART
jgi:hypothetical protein